MNQKRNLASSLSCFSFIVLVAVVVGVATLMTKESSFGFMQTSDALNAANATSSAANATLSKTIQITSADTKGATDGKMFISFFLY